MKTKKHGGVEAHAFVAFGQHVTADTIVLRGLLDGVGNMNNAIVFFDFGTGWIACEPVHTRSEEDTLTAFHRFIGPGKKVESFYSDNAPELVAVAETKLGWTSDTSTPGMPRDNSIAESKVKLVINGARSLLLQAGLPSKYWPYATQAFCNGLNFTILGDRSR